MDTHNSRRFVFLNGSDDLLRSPLYAQEKALRDEVLFIESSLSPTCVSFPFEIDSVHVLCVELDSDGADKVVGCVLFHPNSSDGGRLYQMAVAKHLRGQGLGRELVQRLEVYLINIGFKFVTIHARQNVIGFYESLQYECFESPFEEVGIMHRHMRRNLTITSATDVHRL